MVEAVDKIIETLNYDELQRNIEDAIIYLLPPKAETETKSMKSIVQLVVEWIQEHYAEEMSLSVLANKYHVDSSYLSKMFARYAGINYKDYLQNIRLEHAVKDLENTDKQIVDIAFDHGFANSKAFTNLFRKRYGMLTSEYRKQLVKKKQRESYAHHRALLEKDKKVTL